MIKVIINNIKIILIDNKNNILLIWMIKIVNKLEHINIKLYFNY